MKSEILSQERNVVVVKSEFDSDEVDSAIRKTVRELSNKANIKGFRRGHVPRKTPIAQIRLRPCILVTR